MKFKHLHSIFSNGEVASIEFAKMETLVFLFESLRYWQLAWSPGHQGQKRSNTTWLKHFHHGRHAFVPVGGVLKEPVLHVFLSLHLFATSNKSELQVQFISNDKFFDVFCRRNKVTNIHTFNDLHGRLALVPVGHQCCSRVKPRQDGR